MRRRNVLHSDPERLSVLTGRAMDRDPDPELQRLVTLTSERIEAPIALVSLVLERSQFFRAHVGLPPDLACVASTARDASFCQFVVKTDAPFEVSDARTNEELPQHLVELYGIRSYLGAPVRVRGETVGSLCVIDLVVREFTEEQRRDLVDLAARVSARLEFLSTQYNDHTELLQESLTPVFAEIRNLFCPWSALHSKARVAARELESVARLFGDPKLLRSHAAGALSGAESASVDLNEALSLLEEVGQRIQSAALAIEGATIGAGRGTRLIDSLQQAAVLSHHHLKLVGGARIPEGPDLALDVSRTLAIGLLASAFSLVALARDGEERDTAGIGVNVSISADRAAVTLDWNVDETTRDKVARRLQNLVPSEAALITGTLQALTINLAAAATTPGLPS